MQLAPKNMFFRLFLPLFFPSHLLACCILSWHLLAQVSFAYPLGYKLLDLQQHIQENAPNNRFKREFEFTTPQEHWDLFSQITAAVQDHGNGLAEISYKLPNGNSTPLMHEAEIIHLHDVANLIDIVYRIGMVSALLWIILLAIAYYKKFQLPAIKKILSGFLGGIAAIAIVVLSVGATRLFYWLHTKIFPDGHQWFFYYEDSLMTTLMKAPDIFAFIALLLVSLLVILWIGSVWGMNTMLIKKISAGLPNKKRKRNK